MQANSMYGRLFALDASKRSWLWSRSNWVFECTSLRCLLTNPPSLNVASAIFHGEACPGLRPFVAWSLTCFNNGGMNKSYPSTDPPEAQRRLLAWHTARALCVISSPIDRTICHCIFAFRVLNHCCCNEYAFMRSDTYVMQKYAASLILRGARFREEGMSRKQSGSCNRLLCT